MVRDGLENIIKMNINQSYNQQRSLPFHMNTGI